MASEQDERQRSRAAMASMFADLARLHAETSRVHAALCRELGGNPEAVLNAGAFATEAEMIGPGSDPKVRFNARDWKGPPMKDRAFSRCPWNYLELYAEALESMARNPRDDTARKFAASNLRDARRARSWAKRLRETPDTGANDDAGEIFPGAPAEPAYGARPGRAGGYTDAPANNPPTTDPPEWSSR